MGEAGDVGGEGAHQDVGKGELLDRGHGLQRVPAQATRGEAGGLGQ